MSLCCSSVYLSVAVLLEGLRIFPLRPRLLTPDPLALNPSLLLENSRLQVSLTALLIWDKIQPVGPFPQVKKSRQICLPWRPLPATFAPTVPLALQTR